MRKWMRFVAVGMVVAALLTVTACTRSKLGPAPTVQVTGQVTAAVKTTKTPAAGETVVAAQATSTQVTTPAVGGSPTPLPAMTATTAVEATATPAVETTATPAPTAAATAQPTTTPTTGTEFEYVVTTGDTLWGLALRFGTTVDAIRTRNGLTSDIIYNGTKLIIPGAQGGEQVTHVVQAGENLYRIALKYGTTVEAIAAANNIINPSYVYVGQKLVITKGGTVPDSSTGVRYHVVQPGETLWSIAMRYGTTPWQIAAANGIANVNFIYAGRTLRIP
jgi:peptidoglycan-N-acetylglucosamine deacetylase